MYSVPSGAAVSLFTSFRSASKASFANSDWDIWTVVSGESKTPPCGYRQIQLRRGEQDFITLFNGQRFKRLDDFGEKGFVISETINPKTWLRPDTTARACRLGSYPSSSIAFQTRFANCVSTLATWLTVRGTVAVDTLAGLATSRIPTVPRLVRKMFWREYTLSDVFPGENWFSRSLGQSTCNDAHSLVNVYMIARSCCCALLRRGPVRRLTVRESLCLLPVSLGLVQCGPHRTLDSSGRFWGYARASSNPISTERM
jgi:hypothetical protein